MYTLYIIRKVEGVKKFLEVGIAEKYFEEKLF